MSFKRENDLLDLIKKSVDERAVEKDTAVFDADGTLWLEDANQVLLNYQLKRNRQKFEEFLEDYYQHFHRHLLCELFARKQAGLFLKEFQDQARASLEESPLHVFPFQKKLLSYLKRQDMKIIVVTASIQWLVELAVKIDRLPVDQVLGCRTELEEGDKISDRIVKPSPPLHSKGEVFLQYNKRDSCFLAGGNTLTDRPLLELAELAFVVHSAKKDSVIFSSERKMRELALQKKWLLFETIL